MSLRKLLVVSFAALTALACGSESTTDAGSADTGPALDAAPADASMDAGNADSGADDAGADDAGADDAGADDAGSDDAGAEDAGSEDAGSEDAGSEDAGSEDAGLSTCTMGTAAPIGQLCVTDASTAGGAVTFQVVPSGCRSSSCTLRHTTRCGATRSGNTFDLSALFCLEPTGDGACTSDCGGGGFANCSAGGVEAGSYTATLGSLSVEFTVPSTVAVGGDCDGSPF